MTNKIICALIAETEQPQIVLTVNRVFVKLFLTISVTLSSWKQIRVSIKKRCDRKLLTFQADIVLALYHRDWVLNQSFKHPDGLVMILCKTITPY